MNFDINKTIGLIKGGLIDRETTWSNYFRECPPWQSTAVQLTAPLILANILLGTLLGRLTGGFTPYGYYSNFFSAIFWGLLLACISFVVAVFVFNFLAGHFKGKNNFSRAFAAVSFAAIPSWLAGIVAALVPGFIGMVVALAGGISSLVFMYKVMPLALEIPDEKRVTHFIASLVGIFIINMIVGGIIGGSAMHSSQSDIFQTSSSTSSSSATSGIFGEIARQGQLMEVAGADEYEPPADGKLSKKQVLAYVKVLKKTRALHADYEKKLEKFSKDMEEKEARGEKASLSDMSAAYSGIGGAMGANNAEMEIVKTGGGNWAEHNWVKSQLRTARIQQGDGTEAIAHNYKLFKKYQDDIGDI